MNTQGQKEHKSLHEGFSQVATCRNYLSKMSIAPKIKSPSFAAKSRMEVEQGLKSPGLLHPQVDDGRGGINIVDVHVEREATRSLC